LFQSSDSHLTPDGSSDCVFCCESLTQENYVEYRAIPNGPWLPSVYCELCIQMNFIEKQWQTYLDNIDKADCAAALRRVIGQPPPMNVKDAGLPCKDNGLNEEVQLFWFASDGETHSAKLVGSLEGQAREEFWAEKKAILAFFEKDEAEKGTQH
jgi:hypothetical protein